MSFEQLKMVMRWGREDIAEEELVKVMRDKVSLITTPSQCRNHEFHIKKNIISVNKIAL